MGKRGNFCFGERHIETFFMARKAKAAGLEVGFFSNPMAEKCLVPFTAGIFEE
jgi:hypothetical protein